MRDRHWGDRGFVTGTVGPRGDAYAFDAEAAMTPDEAEEYHLRQGRVKHSAVTQSARVSRVGLTGHIFWTVIQKTS